MEWYQAVIVFAVAFAVAYCMVPVSKKIAFRIGAIDYPGYRRMNREPIPRCGGIALYVGLIAACFTMFLGVRFFDWDLHDLYILSDVNYIVLFVGVTTMFTVGLVDDITQLSPGVKLAGQIVAATVVTLSGITIGAVRTLVVGDYLSLGWIDYPLTVLYLVVFVNITNLIDGLDGLASGLVAIVAGGLLYLVLMRGSFTLVLVCLALIAVCLAFLRYNFLDEYPHLTVIKSISKSYGIPGLRLGIAASGNKDRICLLKKEVAIWNINSLGEFYMQIEEKYRNDYAAALVKVKAERERFAKALGEIPGIRVIPSQADYLMIELTGGHSAGQVTERLLNQYHCLVKDLSSKLSADNRQFLRLAVRNQEEDDVLVDALREILV